MLVYEKDNKLNINFDNKVDNSPDLSIGKSGDKTQILVDGQPSGGGGGADLFIVTITVTDGKPSTISADCTLAEINAAYDDGKIVVGKIVYGGTVIDYVVGGRPFDRTRVNFTKVANINTVASLVSFTNYAIDADGVIKIDASVSIAQ